MDHNYCYPVFFQCPELDAEQRKRIQVYFNIRRKSGGGDCGSVINVGDQLYSVAFKEREAQQRVLEKSEHKLKFANGSLVVIVRNSPEPHSPVSTLSPSQSVTPKLDLAASSQPIRTTSLIPCGEEYELQPDIFLIRYLSECPKSWNDLQSELSALSCSAVISSEEGKVVVRSLAQPAAADKGRHWKSEVDKVFDGFLCHYEVEPHKVKVLLQPCVQQNTDEVKVYTEAGMAVVVGKRAQVDARLMNLEVPTLKCQASVVTEKQISICRLGEGKLRLLWKEIKQRLQQDFPAVKVTHGESGQLVLEGSMNEIVMAVELVSDMEHFVSEKTVPDMSPHFFAFLRKTYGGPGVLRERLGLSDEVEIELRDTELRFFSVSPEKVESAKLKTQEIFKEVKLDVPNLPALLSELREKLTSKTAEMNQGECRAQAVFTSDRSVCLLGHRKEVEELRELVSKLVLDHSSIESKISLPLPELSQMLPELLQLHNLTDNSGVVFHHLTSVSRPMMVLEGPSVKVTEVRKWLVPFLDSLIQTRVIIDMPGALRYLQSSSGIENLKSIAQCQKCLLRLEEQPGESRRSTVASYSLCDGLQVLVCRGDITKLEADALVNAANEDLDHSGGVAAALSRAGGPDIQKESKAIVQQIGKIRTGGVVVTTGGNLTCKKLLHAVGPKGGKEGGREKMKLKETVTSALHLAEVMEFKSIAIPCISSGVFGVPVAVCSEALVTAVKEFGSQGGRSLSKIILIDNREEVVRALHDACDRILQDISGGNCDAGTQNGAAAQNTAGGATAGAATSGGATAGGATAGAPQDGVHVEILQGTIETQQVDALVSPIVGHDPHSTNVAQALSNLAGRELTAKFYTEAGGATQPGDAVLVQDLPVLKSKAVVFLNLAPWDNNQHAVQVLRQGIKKTLASCETRGFTSVAFPVLGTGAVLRFPHSVASRVLLEEISVFEQKRASTSPFLVRVVIHPNDKESSKAFQSAQETLHLRGFTNDTDPAQASFYRHVSVHKDEHIAMLGGVRLQLVYGDIINEKTDAIVNTTDFSKKHVGVSKAILTAAGSSVQAELAQAGAPRDNMCTTGAGSLHCREILHARFRRDPDLFQRNCKNILVHCENKGYSSVSFPAVNTGAAGMDSAKACKAMLDGLAAAIRDLKPNSLALIRIVVQQDHVFQAFQSELKNRFGLMASGHHSLREKAKQKLKKFKEKCSRTSGASVPEKRSISSKPLPAVLNVICCGRDTANTIKRDLEDRIQEHLIERVLDAHELSKLDAMEHEAVLTKVRALGIGLQQRKQQMFQSEIGTGVRRRAGAQSGAEEEAVVLKGLKDDVWSVIELVNKALKTAQQEIDEATLALMVQWSIQDVDGLWHEMSLYDNYMLENALLKNIVFVSVTAPSGTLVEANLTAREATDGLTGFTYKMKRAETDATLELPPQWEPMSGCVFKKVELQPDSEEYKEIAQGFLNTAKYNIQKIERVQNKHLWFAYSLCKQRIFTKNGPGDVGEMHLYHGTSAKSCECIEKDRFDRSYSGTNAAVYGKGVYFAVHANYSASGYSPPDALGLKRLYVARVLTGRYTVGSSDMKAPPPRGTDPTDCFDSLVDHQQQPTKFVIFHDDQAYPEYLITFK